MVVQCTYCSARLHACKVEDHLLICPKLIIPCINTLFGCKRRLIRERVSEHLKVCSASVVQCGMQWNRQLLNKAAKKYFKRVAKGYERVVPKYDVSEKDLDVISAFQDQDEIRQAYRVKRSVRQQQRNYYTPVNPLLPLRLNEEAEQFSETDSSDDELRKNELEMRKKKSPFDGCYLCKLEPGFQHLHVLGCISKMNGDDTTNETDSKLSQSIETLPSFYKNYGLFVDRHVNFINAHHPKGFNFDWVREMHTFTCGQVVRRDEFATHHLYHAHLHQLLDADLCVRCPLWRDGCKFVVSRLKPVNGTIRFNDYLNMFVHEHMPCAGLDLFTKDISLLCWKLVVPYLDSASLKCLCATNSILRHLAQDLCYDQTIVVIEWIRAQENDRNVWIQAGYKRKFSSVQSHINWIMHPASKIGEHLALCPFNDKVKFDEEKICLADRHGIVSKKPELLTKTTKKYINGIYL